MGLAADRDEMLGWWQYKPRPVGQRDARRTLGEHPQSHGTMEMATPEQIAGLDATLTGSFYSL